MVERRPLRNGNGRRRPGAPGVYGPDKVEIAKVALSYGMTDYHLAKVLGLKCTETIYDWQRKHPEFAQALKLGKEAPNQRVERSLYHRAVGYTFDSEKVFAHKLTETTTDPQGNEVRTEKIKITRVPVVEHVPPDTTADIFWMKNRDRENWRESNNHNSIDDGSALNIQEAQVQLLAKVFGVVARLSGRQATAIEARAERTQQG